MYMDDKFQIIDSHFNNMLWPKLLKWLINKSNRTLAQTFKMDAMIFVEKEP